MRSDRDSQPQEPASPVRGSSGISSTDNARTIGMGAQYTVLDSGPDRVLKVPNTLAAAGSGKEELEVVKTAMHESFDEMCRLAGRPDVAADTIEEPDGVPEEQPVT